jgi:hypothetical protein
MGTTRAGQRSTGVLVAALAFAACQTTPLPASDAAPTATATGAAASSVPSTFFPSEAPSSAPSAAPPRGLTWTSRGIPEFTTEGGAGIAGTIDGATRYTHVVVSNLEEACCGGLDASVYDRTADDGASWGQRLLLRGIEPTVAAADGHVYVTLEAYECRSGIGILTNDAHGRRGRWSATNCLTTDGELDSEWAPAIAATGSSVYVAAIDARTKRARVWTSSDNGRSWTDSALGPARPDAAGCCLGPVRVGATSEHVLVAWSDEAKVVARISHDAGRSWEAATALAPGVVSTAAAAGARLAVTGTRTDQGAWIRAWSQQGGWVTVPLPTDGPASETPTGAAVAMNLDPAGALTYFACWLVGTDGTELRLSTASADGLDWSTPEPAPGCAVESVGAEGRLLQIAGPAEDGEGYTLAIGS